MKEVIVASLPNCDICKIDGELTKATYDAKTNLAGQWAYLCETHYNKHGIGLGEGKGQRLIVEEA